jgi:hypothetical protein
VSPPARLESQNPLSSQERALVIVRLTIGETVSFRAVKWKPGGANFPERARVH